MAVSICPICNGRVSRHPVKLECDNCSTFIHIQCLPVDKEEYDVITKRNHGWTCPHCCGILYAFNGIDDDHCFASALYELISDIPVSMDTISHMIFKSLTLNDKSSIPFLRLTQIYSFIINLAIYIMEVVIIIWKTSLINYYTIQNVRKIYHFSMLIWGV